MAQLGRVRKMLKISLMFYGTCPPVLPPVITATAYLLCLLPSSLLNTNCHLQYLRVHISVYAWYSWINESNKNLFSFWITKETYSSMFFNNSSEIWMIDIFVMCDCCVQRFYFLNSEHHAILSNVISKVQVWKNIGFERECSNIKLANMALSKQ